MTRLFVLSLMASVTTFHVAYATTPESAPTPSTMPNGWGNLLATQYPALAPFIGWMAPTAALLIVVLVIWLGFNRLAKVQRDHMARIQTAETDLRRKEKLVLASSFSNELTENKIKCETFITIYSELLRSLRDIERKAPYEDTGDFIHQHPPLSRHVFDENIDKLHVFGTKIAGELTQTYAAIRSEPQYFSLESHTPRATAIRIVEMVMDDAQRTLEPIETLVATLNVIIRDGAKLDMR